MTEELKEIGLNVGHPCVGRLVLQNGISVVRTRKHKVTTDSNHKFNIATNLLDRDFNPDALNQKWAGDINYIWTREGWLYLAVILDLHSRRVIGRAVSNRMKRELAIRALKMAIAFRSPPKGCIHHTDRGSQYCSHDYQKILLQHDFNVSPVDCHRELTRQLQKLSLRIDPCATLPLLDLAGGYWSGRHGIFEDYSEMGSARQDAHPRDCAPDRGVSQHDQEVSADRDS